MTKKNKSERTTAVVTRKPKYPSGEYNIQDQAHLWAEKDGALVPLPQEINVKQISLTLPLALTALAVIVPAIVAWAINYYQTGENYRRSQANKLAIIEMREHNWESREQLSREIHDLISALRDKQAEERTMIKVQQQVVNGLADSVATLRDEQRRIELLLQKQGG